MKLLLVDDEPLALMRLQKMLEYFGFTDIITATNGQKAVEATDKFHPHIVFLDIEMPVLTGIEAAPLIKQCSPESQIIFCTAYDDFAIKAFDLAASDYLLKPVSKDRLKQALDKIIDAKKQTLSFRRGKDIFSLALEDIYCFVSVDKITYMYSQLGRVIIDDSLISLESKFTNEFLRVNRNAIINPHELCGIHRKNMQSFALLSNTEYQPLISRRNITKLKNLLK